MRSGARPEDAIRVCDHTPSRRIKHVQRKCRQPSALAPAGTPRGSDRSAGRTRGAEHAAERAAGGSGVAGPLIEPSTERDCKEAIRLGEHPSARASQGLRFSVVCSVALEQRDWSLDSRCLQPRRAEVRRGGSAGLRLVNVVGRFRTIFRRGRGTTGAPLPRQTEQLSPEHPAAPAEPTARAETRTEPAPAPASRPVCPISTE